MVIAWLYIQTADSKENLNKSATNKKAKWSTQSIKYKYNNLDLSQFPMVGQLKCSMIRNTLINKLLIATTLIA